MSDNEKVLIKDDEFDMEPKIGQATLIEMALIAVAFLVAAAVLMTAISLLPGIA